MIQFYILTSNPVQAMKMVNEMEKNGVRPREVTFIPLVHHVLRVYLKNLTNLRCHF